MYVFLLYTKLLEGNAKVGQLARETLDYDTDPQASVLCADLKPLVNSYIQQLLQIKWNVPVRGRYICLLKTTLWSQQSSNN